MKLSFIVVLIAFFGCSSSKQIVEQIQNDEFTFKSGNFSGQDYFIITKRVNQQIRYKMFIEGSRYFSGVG